MYEEIYSIFNKYIKSGNKISIEDYKIIIDIFIKYNDLKDIVYETRFNNKPSIFRPMLGELNINIKDLDTGYYLNSKIIDQSEKRVYANMYSLFPIFHELSHSIQLRVMDLDNGDIETKMQSIAVHGFGKKNFDELRDRDEYYQKYHDLFIQERTANIDAINHIFELSKYLDESHNETFNQVTYMRQFYYFKDYTKEFASPTKRLYKDIFNRDDIWNYIYYLTERLELSDRMRFGVEVTKDEALKFNNLVLSRKK